MGYISFTVFASWRRELGISWLQRDEVRQPRASDQVAYVLASCLYGVDLGHAVNFFRKFRLAIGDLNEEPFEGEFIRSVRVVIVFGLINVVCV